MNKVWLFLAPWAITILSPLTFLFCRLLGSCNKRPNVFFIASCFFVSSSRTVTREFIWKCCAKLSFCCLLLLLFQPTLECHWDHALVDITFQNGSNRLIARLNDAPCDVDKFSPDEHMSSQENLLNSSGLASKHSHLVTQSTCLFLKDSRMLATSLKVATAAQFLMAVLTLGQLCSQSCKYFHRFPTFRSDVSLKFRKSMKVSCIDMFSFHSLCRRARKTRCLRWGGRWNCVDSCWNYWHWCMK